MKYAVIAATDKGDRESNQDSFYPQTDANSAKKYEPIEGLFMVADGNGLRGDKASQLAIDAAHSYLAKNLTGDCHENIKNAVARATGAVYNDNVKVYSKNMFEKKKYASTTLTLALLRGELLHLGHIGDSRLYVMNGQKATRLITPDARRVQEKIKDGTVSLDHAKILYRGSELLNAVGANTNTRWRYSKIPIANIDRLLLCTDGLTDMLTENEIQEAMAKHELKDTGEMLSNYAKNPEGLVELCAKLENVSAAEAAKRVTAMRDNVTFVLIQLIKDSGGNKNGN